MPTTVGICIGQLDLVQHAQHGEVLVCSNVPQQAHDLIGCLGIEACHRFVGEQHLRALGERTGDCDALRLPTR